MTPSMQRNDRLSPETPARPGAQEGGRHFERREAEGTDERDRPHITAEDGRQVSPVPSIGRADTVRGMDLTKLTPAQAQQIRDSFEDLLALTSEIDAKRDGPERVGQRPRLERCRRQAVVLGQVLGEMRGKANSLGDLIGRPVVSPFMELLDEAHASAYHQRGALEAALGDAAAYERVLVEHRALEARVLNLLDGLGLLGQVLDLVVSQSAYIDQLEADIRSSGRARSLPAIRRRACRG